MPLLERDRNELTTVNGGSTNSGRICKLNGYISTIKWNECKQENIAEGIDAFSDVQGGLLVGDGFVLPENDAFRVHPPSHVDRYRFCTDAFSGVAKLDGAGSPEARVWGNG